MDVLGMEAFLAIVQTRSLTKAAELLHLSQSTVSYRLQMLEREMGATLIERRKGIQAIHLTPFGESFAVLAERWSLLKREVEILQCRGPQTCLTIGAADSLSVYVLPPLYRMLSRQCPAIRLEIRTQHTLESYESMEEREIDIAFVKAERAAPGLIVNPFYVDEMVLVRLRSENRSATDIISPLELDCRQQLYFPWGPAYQLWHDRWWNALTPASLQMDSAALIFSVMWNVEQWAIVPKSIANTLAHPDTFIVQRLSDSPPPRVCYQVMHKNYDSAKEPAVSIINHFVRFIYRNQA